MTPLLANATDRVVVQNVAISAETWICKTMNVAAAQESASSTPKGAAGADSDGMARRCVDPNYLR
jgi:hypothetical protein